MANVKCTSFLSLKHHWGTLGPDTEKKFLETISPELADLYGCLVPGQWLTLAQTVALAEAAAKFLFPQDPDAVRMCKIGALVAKLDLNGLEKLLLKIASVPYAIQQATVIWHTYHDQGETFVEQPGKKHLRFLLFDYPGLLPAYRQIVAGWIRGLLEICGAKNPVVTLLQATPHVAYDIHWE